MASFTYNYTQIYLANRPNGPATAPTPGGFIAENTAMDDGGDEFFTRGETVMIGGIPYPYTFEGTTSIVLSGKTYTFIVVSNGNILLVLGGDIPTDANPAIVNGLLPTTLRLGQLDNRNVNDPFTPCFMAGTLIATPEGARAVETLAVGDLILTTDGRAVPVRWMGRKTVHKATTPAHDFAPVRVSAGALGAGVPQADLLLTGDHALIVDGLAVNASALVNGTTILWEPMSALPDAITYWHVETEAHEEILANGASAETFCDYIGRAHFDNHQEYLDLYGCERIIPEMRRPRISARRQLPADLATRFGIAPFGAAVDAEFDATLTQRAVA